MIQTSQKAHFRAIHQGEDWGMDAWVVLIENRIAAYTVGAALNPTTYGIYMEVTDLTIGIVGLYIRQCLPAIRSLPIDQHRGRRRATAIG